MSDANLDKHFIVIRKRTAGELFDLTLAVLRTEGLRILGWFAVFAVPLTLVNHALLTWVAENILLLDAEEETWPYFYFIGYVGLIALETPFASSPMMIYLGKRVFAADTRPAASEVLVAWVEALPQLVVYTIVLLPLVLVYDCMPEIVSLERSPLFSKMKDQMTTFRRLKNFHRDRFGEQFIMLFPAFLFSVILVPMLATIVYFSFYFCYGPIEQSMQLFFAVCVPIICWTVTLFLIVFHFLRYINMRIEREGWDIELAFRAEHSRLSGGDQ